MKTKHVLIGAAALVVIALIVRARRRKKIPPANVALDPNAWTGRGFVSPDYEG